MPRWPTSVNAVITYQCECADVMVTYQCGWGDHLPVWMCWCRDHLPVWTRWCHNNWQLWMRWSLTSVNALITYQCECADAAGRVRAAWRFYRRICTDICGRWSARACAAWAAARTETTWNSGRTCDSSPPDRALPWRDGAARFSCHTPATQHTTEHHVHTQSWRGTLQIEVFTYMYR